MLHYVSMHEDSQVHRVALVHDFFITYGGAEKVFEALMKLPYTLSLHTSLITKPPEYSVQIQTSFMQKLPFLRRFLTFYKFLLPYAFSSLYFDPKTQVVFSDTASFAKFIIPPPGSIHISYIHTPPRFLWNLDSSIKARSSFILRFFFNLIAGTRQRIDDYLSSQRIHLLVANSLEVRDRIKKYYKRESVVIYPPVQVAEIINALQNYSIKKQNKFLFFNRIEKYKNIDILLKNWPGKYLLTVAGDGSMLEELKKLYADKKNITFIGFVPESNKIALMASHAALVYPNREDFGIIMVESLACGTPVIGLNSGGATEIIKNRVHGILLNEFTSENIQYAVNWILENKSNLETKKLQQHVLKFDKERFIREIKSTIDLAYTKYGTTI